MASLGSEPHIKSFSPPPKLTLPVKLAYGAGDFGAGLTSQFFGLLSAELLNLCGGDGSAGGRFGAGLWQSLGCDQRSAGRAAERSHQNPLGSPLSLDVSHCYSLRPFLLPDLDSPWLREPESSVLVLRDHYDRIFKPFLPRLTCPTRPSLLK